MLMATLVVLSEINFIYSSLFQIMCPTIYAVNGNPVLGNNCIQELQKACGAEIDAVQSRGGPEACQFLSAAITCVVCKKPNCTSFATTLAEEHAEPPSSCMISSNDILMLQQGTSFSKTRVEFCPLITLAKTTTTSPKLTTGTTKPPGKSPQVRDRSGDHDVASLPRPAVLIVLLNGLVAWLTLCR